MNIRDSLAIAIIALAGCAVTDSPPKAEPSFGPKENGYITGTIGSRVFKQPRTASTNFYFKIRNTLTGAEHVVSGPSRAPGGRPTGPIIEKHYVAAPFVLPVEAGSYEIFAIGSRRVTSKQVRVPFRQQKSDFSIAFEIKQGSAIYIGQWLFHHKEPLMSNGLETGAGYWSICTDAKMDMPYINEHFVSAVSATERNLYTGYYVLGLDQALPNVFTGEQACEHRDLSLKAWFRKYGRLPR